MHSNYIQRLINLVTQNKEFYKKYFSYSLPVLIITIVASVLDMIEAILLGKSNAVYMAVLNVTSPFFMMVSLISAAFPTAATAFISKYYGEKDMEKAKKTAWFFIVIVNLFLLFIVTITILNLKFIISILVDKKELQDYAYKYLKIKLIGIIFFANSQLVSAIFKSFLEFYIPFYINFVAILINFSLDVVLIFGYLGFPKLGIVGAAYGYMTSFFLASIVIYFVLLRNEQYKPIFTNIIQFFKQIRTKLYNILLPAISEPLFIQTGYIVFNALINRMDISQISAHRTAMFIESITFIPGFALSQVIQPLSGYYLGKKDEEGLRKTVKLVGILVIMLMTSIGSTFFLFPKIYAGIFTKDKVVSDYASICAQIAFFEQPFLALTFVYLNFMRGLGLNSLSLIVSSFGVWIIRLPMAYLCIFIWRLDIRYIWIIALFDWLTRSILFVIIYNNKKFFSKILKS